MCFWIVEVGEQIIKSGGLEPIIEMVSSEHDVMQNKAVIALAVTCHPRSKVYHFYMVRQSGFQLRVDKNYASSGDCALRLD